MEIINNPKAAGVRKRCPAQQTATQPVQQSVEPLKLERVYGSGSFPAAVSPHPVATGVIAYSSGAVVVVYNSIHKQQTAFYSPKQRRGSVPGKPFACLAYSKDGCYLAAGERGAQSSDILIWEASSGRHLQSLRGHKHGVGSVAFSKDGRYLVSTGEVSDGQLCVWDWQAGVLLAKQHTKTHVARACITDEAAIASGLTIVTVGKEGHFKVWPLSLPTSRAREQVSLTSRPANLKGEFRNSDFVGVAVPPADGSAAPQSQTLLYALTRTGVLLTLRPATRNIDKSVNLTVTAAYALAVSSSLIACACAAGTVRLFAVKTLAFKGNLPRYSTMCAPGGYPAETSSAGGAPGDFSSAAASAGALFPDAVGCAFDCSGERLTVVYSDCSLMVWDMRNPSQGVRARSILSHSGAIWNAALIPSWQTPLLGPAAAAPTPGGKDSDAFGLSSVLCTCGSDGTVRLWNVCLNNSASTAGPLGVPADMAGAARVTRTLRRTLYATPALPLDTGAGAAAYPNRRCNPDAPLPAPGGGAAGPASRPVTLRCVRVSPCGRHLATGDTRGNLRVYDLTRMELLLLREAHDAEILTLDYSPPSVDGSCFLASGSRDMLIHVYDMSRGYELVGTCEAHLGPVTAVRFSACGGRLALLSCSADKSVVFRRVQQGACGLLFEPYHTERVSRDVLYDLAVDPVGGRAVTVGKDNHLRLFDVATGRAIHSFPGDPSCGEAVAVTMDPTGHLAVCSCIDGSVGIYDMEVGALLARGSGHSELCTGAVLLEDYRGLVTVGGDGCALVWRLTQRLAQRMQAAAAECRQQLERQAVAQAAALQQQQQATPEKPRRRAWDIGNSSSGGGAIDVMDIDDPDPQLVLVDLSATIERVRAGKPIVSMEKLPKWAQLDLAREASGAAAVGTTYAANRQEFPQTAAAPANPTAAIPALPAGKWAQRVVAVTAPAPAETTVGAALQAAPAAAAAPPAPAAAPQVSLAVPAASATSSMAARAAALADQPRTWAEAVEDDDEIVFCDDVQEGEQLPGAPQDAAPDPEGAAALFSPRDPTNPEPTGPARYGGPGTDESEQLPGVAKPEMGQESACGSNWLGAPEPEETAEDTDVIRDLFREHFDSLMPDDQASASKPPAPDPRRMSLTYMYRQVRAASGAGASTDPAAMSLMATAAAASRDGVAPGAAALGAAKAAVAVGAVMPGSIRAVLPPTVNAVRGGSATPLAEADGTTTGAEWTQNRSLLPMMSPVQQRAEEQLHELEKIRQRLLSTLQKRQTNDDAAVGASRHATTAGNPAPDAATPASGKPAELAIATASQLPQEAPAPPPQQPLPPQPLPAEALAVTVPAEQGRPGSEAGAAAAPPATAADPTAQSREQMSQGGFLLPPPPAYTPATSLHLTSSITAADPCASPGFSTLSNGTPLLGQYPAEATPGSVSRPEDGGGGTGAAPPRLFVVNPIYGGTPGTPVLSSAADRHIPSQRPCDVGAYSQAAAQPLVAAGEVAATAAADRRRSTADEVIRAVLDRRGDSGVEGSGVCVVKTALPQQQQQEPQHVAAVASQDAARLPEVRSPARRTKAALPAIKPRLDSPARIQAPASSAAASPVGPSTCQENTAAAARTVEGDAGTVDTELQRYADLLRDFTAASARLRALASESSGSGNAAAAMAMARQYSAAVEQEANAFATAGILPQPVASHPCTTQTAAGSEVPPAMACRSPRASLDPPQPPRPPQGSRLGAPVQGLAGPGGSQSMTQSLVTGGGEVTSSQVMVEVALVESLVEEKVQSRVAEEVRRVEEMMRRFMQMQSPRQQL